MENINEYYERQEDGTTILVKSEIVTLSKEAIDRQIADKEAKLLEMYTELQELKNKHL